jgi:tRNA U55 pseudouridine synthase TruB
VDVLAAAAAAGAAPPSPLLDTGVVIQLGMYLRSVAEELKRHKANVEAEEGRITQLRAQQADIERQIKLAAETKIAMQTRQDRLSDFVMSMEIGQREKMVARSKLAEANELLAAAEANEAARLAEYADVLGPLRSGNSSSTSQQ